MMLLLVLLNTLRYSILLDQRSYLFLFWQRGVVDQKVDGSCQIASFLDMFFDRQHKGAKERRHLNTTHVVFRWHSQGGVRVKPNNIKCLKLKWGKGIKPVDEDCLSRPGIAPVVRHEHWVWVWDSAFQCQKIMDQTHQHRNSLHYPL